jgi:hypothetical protein
MSVWLLQFFPCEGGSEMSSNNIYTLLLCFDRILKQFALLLGLKHNGISLIKITLASQARSINQYKNLRTKVMKCCANIYFNQQCLVKKIIPIMHLPCYKNNIYTLLYYFDSKFKTFCFTFRIETQWDVLD